MSDPKESMLSRVVRGATWASHLQDNVKPICPHCAHEGVVVVPDSSEITCRNCGERFCVEVVTRYSTSKLKYREIIQGECVLTGLDGEEHTFNILTRCVYPIEVLTVVIGVHQNRVGFKTAFGESVDANGRLEPGRTEFSQVSHLWTFIDVDSAGMVTAHARVLDTSRGQGLARVLPNDSTRRYGVKRDIVAVFRGEGETRMEGDDEVVMTGYVLHAIDIWVRD